MMDSIRPKKIRSWESRSCQHGADGRLFCWWGKGNESQTRPQGLSHTRDFPCARDRTTKKEELYMEKKELVFISTSIIVANHFSQFVPDPKDATTSDFFAKWYMFLSDQYDACEKTTAG